MKKNIFFLFAMFACVLPAWGECLDEMFTQTEDQFDTQQNDLFVNPSQVEKSDISPLWIHTLTSKDVQESTFKTEEGAEWNIGWWWQSKLKNWEEGDELLIAYFHDARYNYYQFINMTRNESARGNLKGCPDLQSENLVWIESIENHGCSIRLSNGLTVHKKQIFGYSAPFRYWIEGDVILTVYSGGISNPALFNSSTFSIIENLKDVELD